MNKIHKILSLTALLLICNIAIAQVAEGYYDRANGKKTEELKTALHTIIRPHTALTYASLLTHYPKTDWHPDGYFWDMYSTNKRTSLGGMNREHSFPKSWWGGTKNEAYTDIMHLYPTDITANSKRSNFPLGEVGTTSYDNGAIKVGTNTFPGGYTGGSIFEPADEYKGDIARTFMYMVTCYQDYEWKGNAVNFLNQNTYPVFQEWAQTLIMKWHRNDPVSKKEIDRNNAIYGIQHNRNPFIDYPNLAEYLWGDSTEYAFNPSGVIIIDPDPEEPQFEGDSIILANTTFMSTLNPFVQYSATGTTTWKSDSQFGARMDGTTTTATANEDWLISPEYNLSEMNEAYIQFEHVINKGNASVKEANHTLWFTDNYTEDDISSSTWSAATIPTYPTGNDWTYVNSGKVNIPSKYLDYTKFRFAFKYTSSDKEAATWEIKNLKLVGKKVSSAIDEYNTEPTIIYSENGNIIIVSNSNSKYVQIYNMLGQCITNQKINLGKNSIPTNENGMYVIKLDNNAYKVLVK